MPRPSRIPGPGPAPSRHWTDSEECDYEKRVHQVPKGHPVHKVDPAAALFLTPHP
jgi:hypothetical protein